VDATPVNTRFPPDELRALDEWIDRQADQPSRPEAVRRLVGRQLAVEPDSAAKPSAGAKVASRDKRIRRIPR
jgi:hypothetical protein